MLRLVGLVCLALLGTIGAGRTAEAQSGGRGGFPLAPPVPYVTDVELSEDLQMVVQGDVTSTLIAGVRAFDWTLAEQGLTADFQARFPAPDDGQAVEDDRLRFRAYSAAALRPVDRRGFVDRLRAHVDSWTSVERASWHVFEFLVAPDRTRAFLKAHFDLGGPDAGGARSLVTASVAADLVRTDGRWRLRRLDLLDGMRVDNPAPPFLDITDAVGLHFNRSASNRTLRQEILDTRASLIDSGLTVTDWNGDGFWDILATESWDHSVLFVNDGKGGFVRDPLWFDDRRLIPSQALVVDLDNDGRDELVSNRVLYRDGRGWMAIYTRGAGAEWVAHPRALEFQTEPGLQDTDALSLTGGDVNGDGLIDLFVAGYENNQSRDARRFNRVHADDGSDNLLFINQGGLQFAEESDARGITGTQYTYVAQFFDFDDDGDLDLLEGNDYGPNVVWDNQGDGTFRALPDHILARDPNYTMGISIGDWDNTGQWSVYISNMYSHAGNRVVRVTQDTMSDAMEARIRLMAEGNQLFVPGPATGVLEDVGQPLAVNDGGWAWGCVFYDIDNDGDKEIFVVNGNTSFADPDAPDF